MSGSSLLSRDWSSTFFHPLYLSLFENIDRTFSLRLQYRGYLTEGGRKRDFKVLYQLLCSVLYMSLRQGKEQRDSGDSISQTKWKLDILKVESVSRSMKNWKGLVRLGIGFLKSELNSYLVCKFRGKENVFVWWAKFKFFLKLCLGVGFFRLRPCLEIPQPTSHPPWALYRSEMYEFYFIYFIYFSIFYP